VKAFLCVTGLVVALALPPLAGAATQSSLSWTLGPESRRATATWRISGSDGWRVAVVQIATDRALTRNGDFLAQNLVAYDVLNRPRARGTWVSESALPPGEYFGRLKLRYLGPCQSACESATSVRAFTVHPPRLRGVRWNAAAAGSRAAVTWKRPGNGWYVAMVLVDDNRRFRSPEDGVLWRAASRRTSWRSDALAPGTYHVRIRARYAGCDTCLWTSKRKTVVVEAPA
jgi:hypothetical protein